MNIRFDKRRPLALLVITGLLVVPACNRGPSKNVRLQREYNACCKEAADLMTGVTDAASARAAEPRLRAVLLRWDKVTQQLDESYDPEDVSPAEGRGMIKEVGQGIADMQRLAAETLRVSKLPDAVAALGKTWDMLPAAMMLKANGAMPPAASQ